MIPLSRAVARAFRTLARKCVVGRARGPAPPVALRQADGVLVVTTVVGEVGLAWTGPAAGDPVTLTVPMALLDAVEGPGDDPVQLGREKAGRVAARWTDRGVPRSFAGDAVEVNGPFPEPPATLAP